MLTRYRIERSAVLIYEYQFSIFRADICPQVVAHFARRSILAGNRLSQKGKVIRRHHTNQAYVAGSLILEVEAMERGAADYLIKPVIPDDPERLIREALLEGKDDH